MAKMKTRGSLRPPKGLAEGGRKQAQLGPVGVSIRSDFRKLTTRSPVWSFLKIQGGYREPRYGLRPAGLALGDGLECGNAGQPPISRATKHPKRGLLKNTIRQQ